VLWHDSINRSPEQAKSHSKTVGRMVVAVDVAPVVVVVEVVVAADQRPDRSPITSNFHCGFTVSAERLSAYYVLRCISWQAKSLHCEGACGSEVLLQGTKRTKGKKIKACRRMRHVMHRFIP